jgi:hypothetical protein
METDNDLSEDDIICLLEGVNHPSVKYVAVSRIDKYPDNRFLRGFIYLGQNFKWWRSHINPKPSLLIDDSMFWGILCSR